MPKPYDFGVYDYAGKIQFKYRTLMQEYQELHKEVFVAKRKLTATKEKKQILAAEVRFLQKRYKLLVRMKTLNSSQEDKPDLQQNSLGRTKILKGRNLSRKVATTCTLPPIPKLQPNKQKAIKEVALQSASAPTVHYQHQFLITPVGKEAARPNFISDFVMNVKGANAGGINLAYIPNSNIYISPKESLNGGSHDAAFGLNTSNIIRTQSEGFLPNRTPILNLSEASMLQTADGEIPIDYKAIELREAKKSLLQGNIEVRNDLKISICRNDQEVSSNRRKRKISWKDPVALIV